MDQNTFIDRSENSKAIIEAGLIAAALVIPFGIQIGRLGLYGDDWAMVLFPNGNKSDILLAGLTNSALIKIVGINPVFYHGLTIILLFILGMLLNHVYKVIGFDRVSAIASVLLFILFPGFLQPASAIPLFSILTGLIFTFVSIIIYLKWLTGDSLNHFLLAFGLACSLAGLFLSPYSAAIISLTFLFFNPVWLKLSIKKRVFASILGSILFSGGLITTLSQAQMRTDLTIGDLIRTFRIWMNSFIISWRQVLAVPVSGTETLIYILLLIIGFFSLCWFFKLIEHPEGERGDITNIGSFSFYRVVFIVSALAGFGYILLILLAGIPINNQFPNDVPMIVIGIMAAVFAVLGIKLIFLPKYLNVVFAILIVLAAGARYSLVDRYAFENSKIEDFLSQLSVRGDNFKVGSIIISEQLPFDYTSLQSVEALIQNRFGMAGSNQNIHMISADDSGVREFLIDNKRNSEVLRIDGEEIITNKENIIGIWMAPNQCVQILGKTSEISILPQGLKIAAPLCNPALFESINLSDVKQLNQIRTKIETAWCFQYQLANRLVGKENWNEVLQTYKTAEVQGLIHNSFSDFLPLLQASIHKDLFSQSIEISKSLIMSQEQKEIVCNIWNKYQLESGLSKEVISEVVQAQIAIGCP